MAFRNVDVAVEAVTLDRSNRYSGGNYLMGGEVELLDRIRHKSVKELLSEFADKGTDTVYAVQTRNSIHAEQAYMMKSAAEDLKRQGYQKPILW